MGNCKTIGNAMEIVKIGKKIAKFTKVIYSMVFETKYYNKSTFAALMMVLVSYKWLYHNPKLCKVGYIHTTCTVLIFILQIN